MNPQKLNRIGLILGIIGVIIIFIWGPPQPQLTPGLSLALEDATPIGSNGKTVADYNSQTINRRNIYKFMSMLGLFLILLAFAFQLSATWVPSKQTKIIEGEEPENKKSTRDAPT